LATYCEAIALSGRLVAAWRSSDASLHSWERRMRLGRRRGGRTRRVEGVLRA